MQFRRVLLLCAATAAIGCRDLSDDGPSGAAPDASLASTVTVKSFLAGNPASDTEVTFDSVVVVSHVSTRDDGKIWVQDPGGGAQSGIMLFCDFDSSTQMCPMARADVDGLA